MFIGHFALAFAAKRVAPSVSLGTLFLAAQLADLIWPALVLVGFEAVEVRPGATAFTPLEFVHYPYSHSLVALFVWSAALAGVYRLAWRAPPGAALAVAALVLSHWLLDVLSHRPDMPVTLGGSARLGFGLWNSIVATVIVEGALFGIGVALYYRATQARDRVGRIGLGALVGFLLLVYVLNIIGPPPPSGAAVAWVAQAVWLLVAWSWWIDRHRSPAIVR